MPVKTFYFICNFRISSIIFKITDIYALRLFFALHLQFENILYKFIATNIKIATPPSSLISPPFGKPCFRKYFQWSQNIYAWIRSKIMYFKECKSMKKFSTWTKIKLYQNCFQSRLVMSKALLIYSLLNKVLLELRVYVLLS